MVALAIDFTNAVFLLMVVLLAAYTILILHSNVATVTIGAFTLNLMWSCIIVVVNFTL